MLKIAAIWVTRNFASGCHSGSKSNHSRHRHTPVGQIDRQSLSPTTHKVANLGRGYFDYPAKPDSRGNKF